MKMRICLLAMVFLSLKKTTRRCRPMQMLAPVNPGLRKEDDLDHELIARTLLKKAIEQHMADDLIGAEQSYREVLALGHKAAEILPLLAGLVAGRGEISEAIDLWIETVALSPDNAFAHGELGKLQHRAGQSDRAILSFKAALSIEPRNALVLQSLAVAYSSTGDRNRALEIYEELHT
ncbi:MAG: tetratricopeptide repeat protein, partial [Hyphomicrobiales bacterium]